METNNQSSHGRKDEETPDPYGAIESEITPIKRENTADSFPLRDPHECGVGKIHRQIVILLHQLVHTRDIIGCQGRDAHSPTLEYFPQSTLRRSRPP